MKAIYKITNKLNNKSYIGRKKIYSKNYNDLHNYFGSGIHIINSIKKYGIENFKKEYLDVAYSDEELDKKEIYYIENTFRKITEDDIYDEFEQYYIHLVLKN